MASLAISLLDSSPVGTPRQAASARRAPGRSSALSAIWTLGIRMAEAAEAHQQVERGHVADEAKERMHDIERNSRRRPRPAPGAHRRERRDERVLRRPAVQLVLDGARVADEEMLQRRAPMKRAPLLETERREDRDEIHRPRAHVFSSSRSRNCSSASGLASASMFLIGNPWTMLRTASSTILLLLVRGMSVTCTTLRGHVARRRVGADLLLDPVDERLVEHEAILQAHEQDHADVSDLAGRPVLPDDETLDDLGQLLDLAVDLRGADAHASRIERRIRAAVKDDAAVRRQLDVVAMAPDAGKALEVAREVLGVAGVVPERHRHRRERRRADELALQWLPAGIGLPSSS